MAAVSASFFALPAASRRRYKAHSAGLRRTAAVDGIDGGGVPSTGPVDRRP
jgi:hypothetical protein